MSSSAGAPEAGPASAGTPVAVDVHAHLFPQSAVRAESHGLEWFGSSFAAVDRARSAPVVVTGGKRVALGSPEHREPPEARVARMTAMGVQTQVISLLPPLFRYELPPDQGLAAAKEVNNEIADMVRERPDRFVGLATLPLQDVPSSLDEIERAAALGLAGFAMGTHVAGRDLDAAELRPLFRRASEYGCFVLCHPVNPRAAGSLSRFYLSNVIGNPLETTMAFSTLVLGGVLDDAPGMNICFAHGGGYIAAAIGRLGHAAEVRAETVGSSRSPTDYLRAVYVDSLTHDARGLRDLVSRLGADRVLLGSDYPADMGDDDPVGSATSADLTPDDLDRVLYGNAAELFRLRSVVSNSGTVAP